MDDIIGRYSRSSYPSFRTVIYTLIRGCKRKDGSTYKSRSRYLNWVWQAFWRKWMQAPIRCKRGIHRVGEASDTGMGMCENDGCMDVWCLDCDSALRVPIDDALGTRGGEMVLEMSKHLGKSPDEIDM